MMRSTRRLMSRAPSWKNPAILKEGLFRNCSAVASGGLLHGNRAARSQKPHVRAVDAGRRTGTRRSPQDDCVLSPGPLLSPYIRIVGEAAGASWPKGGGFLRFENGGQPPGMLPASEDVKASRTAGQSSRIAPRICLQIGTPDDYPLTTAVADFRERLDDGLALSKPFATDLGMNLSAVDLCQSIHSLAASAQNEGR